MSWVEKILGTSDRVTLVDTDCLNIFSTHSWSTTKKGQNYYVVAETTKSEGKRVVVYLHRLITNAEPHEIVDHINGNTLDNRNSNLRKTDKTGNARNMKARSKHGFKGISKLNRKSNPWTAKITVNYKTINLGTFANAEDAAKAYDTAARLYFGAFGRYNFPIKGEQKA